MTMISSLTSTDLNYVLFRYLHESGFTHSAFTFGFEASINKSTIDPNLVPPGALVTFVQKGIQYLELEANLNNDDLEMDEDFHFLQPLDLMTKDVHELHNIVKVKKEDLQREKQKAKAKVGQVAEPDGDHHKHGSSKEREKENQPKEKENHPREKEHEIGKVENDGEREKSKDKEKPQEDPIPTKHSGDQIDVKHKENGIEGPEPMEICTSSSPLPLDIPNSDVLFLEGHTSEVFACAWNPVGSLLASGSADSTARIWAIGDPPGSPSMQNGTPGVLVLKHFKGRTNEKSKDVTTLDWNGEGSMLATGSYDGQARIWNRNGDLVCSLNKHKGPIFSLKWNKKGDYLLSGSVDKTAVVWDVKTGNWKQQFESHLAPTLDVDWKNNVSFATCSTDSMIHVCKVGEARPVKTFAGHQAEVNAIKWDPTGFLLASCSDDGTAKIWNMKQDTCLHDFKDHAKEIYTIRWSPTGPSTDNPNQQLLLASASFDSTIKLWDVELGRLINSLNGHREPVYTIAFSPNGKYLASGSLDKSVNIWSVKEAKIVKTYSGKGGVFEVCWHKEGNRLAACFANNIVCVLDIRL